MGSVSSAFKTLVVPLAKPIGDVLGTVTGAKASMSAAQQLADMQAQQQTALRNLQTNMAADLQNTEVASVQAGGTADIADTLRKKRTGALGSVLGGL